MKQVSIKAVIFDMDGILLDTETICKRTFKQVGNIYNLTNIEETYKECIGCNKHDSAFILRKHYGKSFPAEIFQEKTSELFHEIEHTEGIPLMTGVKEILTYLTDNNYRIAVASSTRGITVRQQLKDAGIADFFETFTTGDLVVHAKPDPEIYKMACKSLNLEPQQCAAVEDSYNGIRSAHKAQMKSIMIPDQLPPTDEMKELAWKIYPTLHGLKELF